MQMYMHTLLKQMNLILTKSLLQLVLVMATTDLYLRIQHLRLIELVFFSLLAVQLAVVLHIMSGSRQMVVPQLLKAFDFSKTIFKI